jgi:hypothetical protein
MEVDLGRRQPMDGKPRARLRTGRGHGTRGHDGHALAAIGRRGGGWRATGREHGAVLSVLHLVGRLGC